jgi:hypothetical protein
MDSKQTHSNMDDTDFIHMMSNKNHWPFSKHYHNLSFFQASEEFKDKNLNIIDDRFTKAGENLMVISLENSHCLDAVIECEPLVKWLRETIKGDCHVKTYDRSSLDRK